MNVIADATIALTAAPMAIFAWLAITLNRTAPPRAAAVSTSGRRGPRPDAAPVGPPPFFYRGFAAA